MEINNNKPVIWEADSTHPDLATTLRESLREVNDPELGLNIIQLGLVREVHIDSGTAHVKMLLTTPFCPYGPSMLEMTRHKTEEVLKRPTTIELSMEMWDFSMMEEGAGADWGLF